jgi:hypothetical protein
MSTEIFLFLSFRNTSTDLLYLNCPQSDQDRFSLISMLQSTSEIKKIGGNPAANPSLLKFVLGPGKIHQEKFELSGFTNGNYMIAINSRCTYSKWDDLIGNELPFQKVQFDSINFLK